MIKILIVQTTLLSWLIVAKQVILLWKKVIFAFLWCIWMEIYIWKILYILSFKQNIFYTSFYQQGGLYSVQLEFCWYVFDNTRFNTESKECLYFLKQYQKNIWCNLKEKHTSLGHCKMKDINKFQVVVESIKFF